MAAITMKKVTGFSLIELMIVVAVVAILAAVAFPSYGSYVRKSHRTDAINMVMNTASQEARYYTGNNAYTNSMANLGFASGLSANGYYSISVSVNGNSFTITATPQGDQANDSCGTYTYTNLGVKTSGGSLSECWKQ